MPIIKSPREFWKTYGELIQSRKKVVLWASSVALALCVSLQHSGTIESLEDRIGRPLLFFIRQELDLAPKLDPRVVIYAYDDEAVSTWGRPELLSGRQWDEMISAIADHKPKAILIDMIFAHKRVEPTDLTAMNRAFKKSVPIVTGSAVFPKKAGRTGFLLGDEPNYFSSPNYRDFFRKYDGDSLEKLIFGPAPNLPNVHKNLSHINFRAPGFAKPIIPIPPDKYLKHMGLGAASFADVKIDGTSLFINGHKVSLNDNGEVIINWGTKKNYFANTYKIQNLLEVRRNKQFSRAIDSESVVLFLPLMFTGNADYKETHIGQVIGGYVNVAMVNSVLSGQWIRIFDPAYFGIFIALLAAFWGSLFARNSTMILYCFAVNALVLLVAIGLFLTKSVLSEWMNVLLAFNVTLLSVIVFTQVVEEIKSIRIHDALTGVLSPKMLNQIRKSPEEFKLVAVEQTVTVMFVDFVGFSLVAEQMASKLVFESLKKHFSDLSKIIHKYHGIVDKSLGDGLMGVFGFDPITREISGSHAEDAVLCGIEIQKFMAEECASFRKSDANSDAVIFASRLGLNTGTVFIGNIGDQGRLDLTVIGHTVNMAKRLEDACEPFKVLLGQNTQQYLPGKMRQLLTKRDVQIKHHKDLIHSFELDPFQENPQLYSKALDEFRKFSNISRLAERLVVPPDQTWMIAQNGVKVGTVIDYSANGLCVDLKNFYGNKVPISFDLIVKDKTSDKVLQEIRDLHSIVKWGRKADVEFRHGLILSDESATRFKSLTTPVSS